MRTAVVAAGLIDEQPAELCDCIGVDRGAQRLAEWGRRMKLAIGDFDSSARLELISQYADQVTVLNRHKDDTDLEAAVYWALSRYDHLIVYGALGGRLDHEWAALSLITVRDLPIEFRNKKNRICRLNEGTYHIRREGYRYLSFFPLGSLTISETGTAYPLADRRVSPSDLYLVSNEIIGEEALVKVTGPVLMCQSSD